MPDAPDPAAAVPEFLADVPAQVRRLLLLGTRPTEIADAFREIIARYVDQTLATVAHEIAANCRREYVANCRRSPDPPWAWSADGPPAPRPWLDIFATMDPADRRALLAEIRDHLADLPDAPRPVCRICGHRPYARGLCSRHYRQWLQEGKPDVAAFIARRLL